MLVPVKFCRKCKEEKPSAEFYVHKLTSDGRNSYCKKCAISEAAAWGKVNIEQRRRNVLRCNAAHPQRMYEASKRWKEKNKKGQRAYALKWQKEHPAASNARNGRHRAQKLLATPAWTNHVAVGEMYAFAALKTKLTGQSWHVDHIVPLRSKLVCGLHTHYNLQVIPGAANTAKGNRYWPDMPDLKVA